MKVLSILQPWASLIIQGHKKIETRSWYTKYRGELLIHASKKKIRLQDGMFDLIDHMQRIGFWDGYPDLPYGAIIGKVNLVGTCPVALLEKHNCTINGQRFELSEQERAFGDYSAGRFAWLLSDPVMLEKPIPVQGKLGLWEFSTTPHLETYLEDDVCEFERCSNCDGHDACEDFGCAIEAGLAHLLNR